MNNFNTKQRFSIRKYHIGAASVLLGAFIGLNTTSAQAADEKVTEPITESNATVAQPISTSVPKTLVEGQPANTTNATETVVTSETTVAPEVAESTIAESVTIPTEYKSDAKITVSEEFKNALLERERIMRDIPATQTESAYLKSGSEIETNAAHKTNHETLKRLGQELFDKNQYKNTTDIRPVNLMEIDSVHREEINLFAVDLINQLRAGIGNQEKLVPAKGMFDFAKDVVKNTKFETPGAKHQYSVINESAKNAGLSYVEDPVAAKNSQRQQDLVYFKPRTEFSLPLKEELKNRLKSLPNEWSADNVNAVKYNYGIDLDNGKIDQYDWSDMIIHSPNYVPSTTAQKNGDAQKLLADIWQEQSMIPMGKLKEYVYEGIKRLAFKSGDDYFTDSKRYWELALSTFGEFYAENNKYAAVTWSLRGSNTNLGEVDKNNPYSGRRAVLQNLFIHNSYTAPKDASEYALQENQESKKDAIKHSVNKIIADNFDRTPLTLKEKVETIYKDNGDGGLNAFTKTTKADGTITEVPDTPNNKVKSTVQLDKVSKTVRYEADTASQFTAGTETSRVAGKDGYTEKTTTWSLDAQGQPKENVREDKIEMVQEVVKISTKSDVENTPLTKTIEYKEVPTKEFGYRETTIKGSDGSLVKTTTYTLKSDGTVEKNPVQESRTEPVNEVIEVGTKPKERTETETKGTRYESNPDLAANTQNVKVTGKDGSKVFVTEYDFDAATGKVTPRAEVLKVGSEVAVQEQVIEVGTKSVERTETITRAVKYVGNPNLTTEQNVLVEGKDGVKKYETTYRLDTAKGIAVANPEVLISEEKAEERVVELKLEEKQVAPLPGGKQLTWVKKVGFLNGEPLENPKHRDLTDDELKSLMKPKDNTLLPGGKLSIDDQLRLLMIPKGEPILPGVKLPSTGKGGSLTEPEKPILQLPGDNGGDNGQVTPPSNNKGGNNGQVTPPSNNKGGNNGLVTKSTSKSTKKVASANVLPKTSSTTTNSAALPAGLVAALASAGLLAAKRRKED